MQVFLIFYCCFFVLVCKFFTHKSIILFLQFYDPKNLLFEATLPWGVLIDLFVVACVVDVMGYTRERYLYVLLSSFIHSFITMHVVIFWNLFFYCYYYYNNETFTRTTIVMFHVILVILVSFMSIAFSTSNPFPACEFLAKKISLTFDFTSETARAKDKVS